MTIRRRTELERYLAFRVALDTPDDDAPGGVVRREGRLDVADVQRVQVPNGLSITPAQWAKAVFDVRRAPIVVRALMGLRQLVVPLIGVPRTVDNPFRVREIREDEALLLTRERQLTFWCSAWGRGTASSRSPRLFDCTGGGGGFTGCRCRCCTAQ